MQFDQNALDKKIEYLDEIKKHPEYVEEVFSRHFGHDIEIHEVPRRWIGGGATSYIVISDTGKAFVKIKHESVTVESKLEEETDFIKESCLEHEYHMLLKAEEAGVSVPKVLFYDEYMDFRFLATEYIEDSLEDFFASASIEDILNLWVDLTENVRKLYAAGLVHSDLHEYNIRCVNSRVKLIDFEECRALKQSCEFERSLDYTGRNELSCLGEFPLCNEQDYPIRINSLARLRLVFKKYASEVIGEFVEECNYDSSNGICITIDHGKSEKTYQSIQNEYFNICGQRDTADRRPKLVCKINDILFPSAAFTFIDIGSNNGLFVREINKYFAKRCRPIGLEGFPKFNKLARGLAFLEDCTEAEFYDFVCGEDDLCSLNTDTDVFVNICSVWHHIQKKDELIQQLKSVRTQFIFFEMAVQEECYGGCSWRSELDNVIKKLDFEGIYEIGLSEDYKRPMVLVSRKKISEDTKKKIIKTYKKIYRKSFFERLFL